MMKKYRVKRRKGEKNMRKRISALLLTLAMTVSSVGTVYAEETPSEPEYESVFLAEQMEEAAESEAVESEETENEETESTETEDAELAKEMEEALNDPLYSKYMYMTEQVDDYRPSTSLIHDARFNKALKIIGIDVSKWQQDIDWGKVKKSGVSFTIIRLGYRGMQNGTLQMDEKFDANIKGAHAAGITTGIYFFTQALNVKEAEEEAQYVIDVLKKYPGHVSYPVIMDMETLAGSRFDNAGLTPAAKTAIAKAFCAKIQSAGYRAGIYSNKNYLQTQLNMAELEKDYYVWMAQYNNHSDYAGKYDMWQYSSAGMIDGISTRVDMDVAYVQTVPGTPKGLKQTGAKETSLSLAWDAVDNADGYKVHFYDANGKLLQLVNVKENKVTLKDLKPGKLYQYQVCTFYGSGDNSSTFGNLSEPYKVHTTSAQVTNLAVQSRGEDALILTWKKVSGVSGYRIAQYDAKTKKYVLAGTTETTANTYKVTKLKPGGNYKFKVQGYVLLNGTVRNVGQYSDALSTCTRPAQVTKLVVKSVTDKSVTLSWKSQSGVNGYRVECYDSKGKLLYNEIVKRNTYKDTKVKAGTTYRYRVRSYITQENETKVWGAPSEKVKTDTKLGQISKLTEKSASKNRLVLSWEKIRRADGYRISLYNEKTKKYDVLGTTSKTNYTIKGLKAGKKYKVKVAAYEKAGKKTVYGKTSAIFTAVTKPDKVVKVKQSAKTSESFTVKWARIKEADGYVVQVYDAKGKSVGKYTTAKPAYKVKGLKPGKYTCRVSAYLEAGGKQYRGVMSDSVTVRVK